MISPSKRTGSLSRSRAQRPENPGIHQKLYDIIFEADTFAGRLFDIFLLMAILGSISVIALETVPSLKNNPRAMLGLRWAEWFFTLLFSIEYIVRLFCSRHPTRYALSFWGLIDMLSSIPMVMLGLLGNGQNSFVILRSVRLLRVFRILKLWRMMREADSLWQAVWQSRDKIIVFVGVVMVAITLSGTLMYHVEYRPPINGVSQSEFTSIPQSMYWAIVTMTTVGYGDIVPMTTVGKVISAALILLGYSLIIVPSGFVIAEVSASQVMTSPNVNRDSPECPRCHRGGHAADANYCCQCGEKLLA